MFGGFLQDLRYGARMLLKSPTYTAIAIAALALSIGANTAVFSAVNTLLLRPLPLKDLDRLVFSVALREGFDPFGSSLLEFEAYRHRNHSFESIGVAMQRSVNLIGRGEPERIRGALIMADYFTTLGVNPILGRSLTLEEDQPGGPAVAMIGYGLWQKHFGGDTRVIGEKLNLEGRSYTVIGVMPPDFDLPEAAEIWLPLQTKIDSLPLTDRAVPGYEVVAKLRPGVSLRQADAESKSIARQLEQEFPQVRRGWGVKLIWLRQELLGDLAGRVNKALVALIGGVGFLLLICCANVANLQLARGFARTRELALRRALGASRSRLIRQLLTESMLLALLGGAAGLVLAHWIVPLLAAINPIQGISLAGFFHNFRIDSRVLAFALLVTLATGAIFGLLPALKAAGEREVMPSLKQGDQHSASAPGHGWLNVLIVSEIAIAMTLLVAGGLIARSFNRLQHVDLGFKSDNLLTVKMILPASKYSEYRQRIAFVDQELAREAWPGEDPLGKRIKRVRPNQDFPWMTVIGVVKDVKEDLFNYRINRPVWYVPYAQLENNFPVNLVVRTSSYPASVIAAVREAIHAVDPDQPVSNVMTMNENLAGVLVTERFSAILMNALGASGLLLAALGLYGVMAYSVSQRTAEIGVRVALGAQRIHVLQLILSQGAKLTLLGVVIGVAAAWALTRLLGGLLFEVNATDPATFLYISLLLVSIALVACFLPARRALSVDPVIALRAE